MRSLFRCSVAIEAMGFDPADLSDKQKAALQAKFDAEIKAAAKARLTTHSW